MISQSTTEVSKKEPTPSHEDLLARFQQQTEKCLIF
jgi:hypothetical protein